MWSSSSKRKRPRAPPLDEFGANRIRQHATRAAEFQPAVPRCLEEPATQEVLDGRAEHGPGRFAELGVKSRFIETLFATQGQKTGLGHSHAAIDNLFLADGPTPRPDRIVPHRAHARVRVASAVGSPGARGVGRVRADPQAEHRSALPVAPIVDRCVARPGVVGELVAPIPRLAEPLLDALHHARRALLGIGLQPAVLRGPAKRRRRLEDQFVTGNVFGPESRGLGEIGLEHGGRLVERREHEIQREVGKTRFAGGGQGAPARIAGVGSAQGLEERVVKGLHPQRKPGHPGLAAKAGQGLALDCARVDLQGDLGVLGTNGKFGLYGLADPGQGVRPKQRRRPSTKVEAGQGATPKGRGAKRQLRQHPRHVTLFARAPIPRLGIPRPGIPRPGAVRGHRLHGEIAVGANPGAKGDVDVDAQGGIH